jgi:hypothetical protein
MTRGSHFARTWRPSRRLLDAGPQPGVPERSPARVHSSSQSSARHARLSWAVLGARGSFQYLNTCAWLPSATGTRGLSRLVRRGNRGNRRARRRTCQQGVGGFVASNERAYSDRGPEPEPPTTGGSPDRGNGRIPTVVGCIVLDEIVRVNGRHTNRPWPVYRGRFGVPWRDKGRPDSAPERGDP